MALILAEPLPPDPRHSTLLAVLFVGQSDGKVKVPVAVIAMVCGSVSNHTAALGNPDGLTPQAELPQIVPASPVFFTLSVGINVLEEVTLVAVIL